MGVIRILPGGYMDETGPHRGLPPSPWWFMHKEIFLMTGVELIAEERKRQIDVEVWTAQHDDDHQHGELVKRAAALAVSHTDAIVMDDGERVLPWKEHLAPRSLIIAGALIAAEIDRLQRAKDATVIATVTTPVTDEIRSVLSEAEAANSVHLSEVGELTEDDVKAFESQPSNPTLKFDHWSIPKEK